MSTVINSTFVERRHGAQFMANLLTIKFSKLFAQPVYREALSGGEKELNDRLGRRSPPTLSAFGRAWLIGREKRATNPGRLVRLNSAPIEEP
jgi:hypothetical protein